MIKDFMCKPANEAEAIEIVKRALANGAGKNDVPTTFDGEYHYVWNQYPYWGVFRGKTRTGDINWSKEIINIDEVRAMLPCEEYDGKPEPEWNGEGLPPVGVDCQMRFDGDWIQAKIIGFDENNPIVKMHIKRDRFTEIVYRACYMCTFRPIRTEREKWIDDTLALDCNPREGMLSRKDFVAEIYDAIKSGKLKAPEAE